MVRELKAKFVELMILSLLIMQLGFAINGVGYMPKPEATITTSSTVIGVNKTTGLQLTMQIEKTVYNQSEPVNITFTLTNISNQTITFGMTAWSFDFLVLNATNHVVFQYSTSQIFPMYVVDESIDPGQSLTTVEVWPGRCNASGWTAGLPASPGTYYIVGQFCNISNEDILVRTPPLQITVVPVLCASISPSSVAMDVGQFVTFTSNVTGDTPPFSYQWWLDGAPASGATHPSWTFRPSSSGFYNVSLVVTNTPGGIATSSTASVTVNPALSISISPSNVTLVTGMSQTFTASITGGTQPYTYYWGSGSNLSSAAISAGTNGPTTNNTWILTFNSAGNYTIYCLVADSSKGTSNGWWTTASVTVNAPSATDSTPHGGGGGGACYLR
jgi:plastocyanin